MNQSTSKPNLEFHITVMKLKKEKNLLSSSTSKTRHATCMYSNSKNLKNDPMRKKIVDNKTNLDGEIGRESPSE